MIVLNSSPFTIAPERLTQANHLREVTSAIRSLKELPEQLWLNRTGEIPFIVQGSLWTLETSNSARSAIALTSNFAKDVTREPNALPNCPEKLKILKPLSLKSTEVALWENSHSGLSAPIPIPIAPTNSCIQGLGTLKS
ncbi:MAG: hypothetical protein HY785_07150 [Oscillatoriophycideae cyanobacterium NC_groundwater_1537_Pr4_S-0.65um_50_18]|nr:hypothetical protein [Oscillatoriophycideae cyanobacterium NC_groundwater_1537_Pr4_S-0.65um_50_18]